MELQQKRLEAFIGKMVGDLGAGVTGALVLIGDRLGLYKAMVELGPCTAEQLAEATDTNERYIREWLHNQAAAGYLEYDGALDRFTLPPEHAAALADENSPVYMVGGFYSIGSVFHDEEKLAQAFKTGEGMSWGDHHACLFCGTAKFFRPSYAANLVSSWIPALHGVRSRLQQGTAVADVGCGFGESTMIMAKAFPNSYFTGYDIHSGSIEQARQRATERGITNVSFEIAKAKEFEGNYDFITFFDCLHDMGDPVGAAAHAYQALNPGGTLMAVEPFAHDELAENLTPVSQVYYGFSATVCVPASMAQEVRAALGAQAGPAKLTAVLSEAGFDHVRVATETPFNLIMEAQK